MKGKPFAAIQGSVPPHVPFNEQGIPTNILFMASDHRQYWPYVIIEVCFLRELCMRRIDKGIVGLIEQVGLLGTVTKLKHYANQIILEFYVNLSFKFDGNG